MPLAVPFTALPDLCISSPFPRCLRGRGHREPGANTEPPRACGEVSGAGIYLQFSLFDSSNYVCPFLCRSPLIFSVLLLPFLYEEVGQLMFKASFISLGLAGQGFTSVLIPQSVGQG